jgi:hypothetical protein
MAGKLRIPDAPKAPAQEDVPTTVSLPQEKQIKKTEREPEKPWVGTAALRGLSKKREAAQNLDAQNINVGRPNNNNLDVLTPKEQIWTPKNEAKTSNLDAKTPKENNLGVQNSNNSRKWVKYESQRTTDRLSLRPNAETLHKFKIFCAEKKLTLTEFFEIAGQKLIDLDAQIPETLGVLTPYDDRRLDILYKTNARIINLFLEYNKIFNEKTDWKMKDDAVGVKYNDIDFRTIEIGIIQTQANILESESETKVERFKYYTREIDKIAALGYNEQMLDAILEIHRRRWKEMTGREIDFESFKSKSENITMS